jgi:hypothetical protein
MANWKFYLDGNEVEEPIGWDAIEFTALRMESHGIDQPFSTEMRFYNAGAKYIKTIYDQYFINQPIAIQITSDVGYNGTPYVFDGFLNMAIYQEHNVCDTDSWEITVGIIDDNFREHFKSRQDAELDLTTTTDLNGSTIGALTFKEIRLHKQDLYLTANGQSLANTGALLNNDTFGPATRRFVVVPCYWQASDFVGSFGKTFDTNLLTIFGLGNLGNSPIFVNNGTTTRTFEFIIKIKFQATASVAIPNPVDVGLNLAVFSGNTLQSVQTLILITLTAGQQTTIDQTFTGSITVPVGQKINLYFGSSFSTVTDPVFVGIYKGAAVNLSEYSSGTYATDADVLTIEQWLRRTIYVMTGSNDKLLSDTFSESGDGCYWNNALTNGLRIRNAEGSINSSQLITTWKQVFEDLDKIFCLGWAFEWTGLEWKIRVETRDYFYQNIVSQAFENVGEVNQLAKTENLVNSIKIGFSEKWKNIQLSGAFAIHTDRNYFIQNRAMKEGSSSKLDLTSQIIGEGYAIEFYRRMAEITFGAASSDRPNDYDTFIIWLNRFTLSGSNVENSVFRYPDESGAFSFAPGTVSMPSDFITASNSPLNGLYNIYHTPARIACRWWKVLGMHTYGMTTPVLQYQVGQYQTNYSSTIDGSEEKSDCIEIAGGAIAEDSNISAAILNAAYQEYLFKPIGVEFSYPQSLCDFLTLSQDEQYKKVRLTSGSLVIEGFIQEATNQPEDASGGTTKFNLIVSAQQSEPGGAFDTGFNSGYDIEN